MRIHTCWYRRYFALLTIIFSNVLSSIADAEDMGQERACCYPGSLSNNTTPASFSYNSGTIVVPNVNRNASSTILPSQIWKVGAYKAYCNSLDDYEIYSSTISGIGPSGVNGGHQGNDVFIPLTHEISVSTRIKLYNQNDTMTDKIAPFEDYNTNYPGDRSKPSNWASGTEGCIEIRIDKEIISDVSLNNVLLVSLCVSQIPTEHDPIPVFNAYIGNLDIQVPQNCTVNEDTSFIVNMPDVWASELSWASAGTEPADVTPVVTTIPINCTSKGTDAVMTLVFGGNISATRGADGKQSIIRAQGNPGVGITIMGSQQNSIDLNALATSVGVPFRLVENQAASTQTADAAFLTLPISTTGKVPTADHCSALAILRVEYQ